MSKDGGPAFPQWVGENPLPSVEDGKVSMVGSGMSLRDWFAGQILPIAIDATQANLVRNNSYLQLHEPTIAEAAAGRAYLIADAMLKERDRK